MAVAVETTIGDFIVDLYCDKRPQTCKNFLKLCKTKYYNWSLFHTVQSNFIAQTGDPKGTGRGGESIFGQMYGEQARYYKAEEMPKIKHDRVGLLSMVNCGDNMLGSQFFVTLAPELQSLDNDHCVFGEIAEGLEVVLKFNEAICDEQHRPYQDIRISHTVILEDPFEDPEALVVPDRSPEPTKECLMSDRVGADEVIDDAEGLTTEQIIEMQREKEAKARATILEIIGDIPDAEIAPPENVLFVCKLNPVTTDDDLEIIFSRFGKIIGCEVIRDKKTGDSLQYAFIEFADRKSCEDAYFKMDNVLIDDRRIHVDFSQSVSKMRWRGKGRGIDHYDERQQRERRDNNRNSSRNGDESRKRRNRHSSSDDERRRERTDDRRHRDKEEKRKDSRRRSRSLSEDRKYKTKKYDSRKDRSEREDERRSRHGRSERDFKDDRYKSGSKDYHKSNRDRSRDRHRDKNEDYKRKSKSDRRK